MMSKATFHRALRVPAIVAFVAAISCGEKTPSQIVLVVQSDMMIPKDVTHVRIEVLSSGSLQFGNEYEVGPTGVRIPSTLGILPGKDATAPLTVRVIAKRNAKVRTLREIVTTFPKNRNVQLRVPIQWMCADKATDSSGQPESACPKGQSCVDGLCESNSIQESDLPEYSDETVFGGGTAADSNAGKCFDVDTCFNGAIEVPVDMTDCSVPSGGVDPSRANIAVRPSTGEGICNARGECYVPVDGDTTQDTWAGSRAPVLAGKLALPKGVCRKIADDRAAGQQSRLFLSGACLVKTQSIPPCGPWSSTGTPIQPLDGSGNQSPNTTAGVVRCTESSTCVIGPNVGEGDVCCLESGNDAFSCRPGASCRESPSTGRYVARICDTADDCAGGVCCEGPLGSRCITGATACTQTNEGEPCSISDPVCPTGKTCKRCEYRGFGAPTWQSSICVTNGVCPTLPDGG